ncbi:MAG: DEAD/DEAH box helicase [Planctomycetota bacterium]
MDLLKKRLPRTFGTFFGRFDRLTEVQIQAMPPLLDGRDVLMCAPTASGKTEAYAAPSAEAVLAGDRGHLHTLIVSPTRALANDLKRRLEGRFQELNVPIGRYTGEHKERKKAGLPEVTITTPEALDSLLARRSRMLGSMRMIVLDEIHVLDGTPRGDQLRVLLHRAEQVAEHPPQRIAVSATVDDPEETASRYLRDAAVISVEGARTVRVRSFHGRSSSDMVAHLKALTDAGFRKVLVFCNRRDAVEQYASDLKGRCIFGDAVFPHHGSLSKIVRERTERRFLEAPAAVAFATMTLELGIDIGTVDYVLLDQPPPDVSSLLQRIGRGSRRTDVTRAGIVVGDPGEAIVYRVLLQNGARGHLLAPPYGFRPGVLVQQALVTAGAQDWITAEGFRELVPKELWSTIAPIGAFDLLHELAENALLEDEVSGRYVATESITARYETGKLHSNLGEGDATQIVDRLTGEVIGHFEGREEGDSDHMTLGGGGRRRVGNARRGRVLTDPTKINVPSQFSPRISPCCSFAQGRAVAKALGVEPLQIAQVILEATTLLIHGLGRIGGLLLAKAIKDRGGDRSLIGVTPYVIRSVRPIEHLPRPDAGEVLELVQSQRKRLAKLLSMGPWHRVLPVSLQEQSVLTASGLEQVRAFLEEATFEPEADPETIDVEAARYL